MLVTGVVTQGCQNCGSPDSEGVPANPENSQYVETYKVRYIDPSNSVLSLTNVANGFDNTFIFQGNTVATK